MSRKGLKIALFATFALALLVALAGFWRSPYRIAEIALVAHSVLWTIFRKRAPGLFLFLSISMASTGILLLGRPFFMVVYAGLSIACWDLARTESLLDEYPAGIGIGSYLRVRIASLAAIIALGIGLAFFSGSFRIKAPFALMLGLVPLAFFLIGKFMSCLSRVDK